MVGTILPIGYGEQQRSQPPVATLLHVAAYVVGAVLAGATLGFLGSLLSPLGQVIQVPILILVAAAYGIHELGLARMPAPEFRRQVQQHWRTALPPRLLAIVYGLELGAGLTTFVSSTSFYVVVLWIVTRGSAFEGAAMLSLYAFGRAVPVLLIAMRTSSAIQSGTVVSKLLLWRPAVRVANGYLLGFVAACTAAGALASR